MFRLTIESSEHIEELSIKFKSGELITTAGKYDEGALGSSSNAVVPQTLLAESSALMKSTKGGSKSASPKKKSEVVINIPSSENRQPDTSGMAGEEF